MLKITTPYGFLKLPHDIEIPLTITNPMVNERGSYSLPFTVPEKPNREALGFPASLSSKSIVGQFIDCTIEQNFIKEKGTLKIIDVDGSGNIELSLTSREGAFWEWAKKTELRNITTSSNRAFDVESTFEQYFDKIWPEVDMAFFPIAISKLSTDPLATLPNYNDTVYYSGNELVFRNHEVLNNPNNLMRVQLSALRKDITGFLYVNEILKWILSTYGLKFNVNDLSAIPEMNSLVVLNAATRPFRNDVTHLSELLPSGTVMEFIDAIEKTFCCQFYCQSYKKAISIKLHKNVIGGSINSLSARALPSNLTIPGKQITLDADKIDSENTTIDDNCTEEFIRTFNNFREEESPVRENGVIYKSGTSPDYTNYPNEIVFNIPTQCYFSLKWEEVETNSWKYKATVFQSRYKPYIPTTTLEKKEIKSPASFAPMVKVNFRQFYSPSTNVYNAFDYSMLLPHFNVEKQQYDENIGGEYYYNTNVKTPITFAFSRGRHRVFFPDTYNQIDVGNYGYAWRPKTGQIVFKSAAFWDIPWGSTDVYAYDGIKIAGDRPDQPNIGHANIAIRWVGDYGLLNNFYKEYEGFILKSCKEVNIDIQDLKKAIIEDVFNKYQFDDAYFILGKIEITLTAMGIKFDSATGYTLKPYN